MSEVHGEEVPGAAPHLQEPHLQLLRRAQPGDKEEPSLEHLRGKREIAEEKRAR